MMIVCVRIILGFTISKTESDYKYRSMSLQETTRSVAYIARSKIRLKDNSGIRLA